jgi:hypothetical protein
MSPFATGIWNIIKFVLINAGICSLICNILPKAKRTDGAYHFFIDVMSFCAFNWRACLPSLDLHFLGFKRHVRHGIRNFRQRLADRKYRNGLKPVTDTHNSSTITPD